MRKYFNYLLSLVGLGILILGLKPVEGFKDSIGLTSVEGNILIGVGIVLTSLGVFMLRRGPRSMANKEKEVPVYEGHSKEVVAYRRMGKK